MKTIFTDPNSLIKSIKDCLKVKNSNKTWWDYIKMFGLRNHAYHGGKV